MIGSLRGTVIDRLLPGELLVEVGGVGYRVAVTAATMALFPVGGPCFLHVHTHVREEALVLYGFPTGEERSCFEALLAAHGVGPALALAVLSAHSPATLRRAVATDDLDALTLVPGVGRKTAARLLLDLKTRLGGGDDLDELVRAGGGGDPEEADARAEVRAALAGLGYGPEEVRAVTRDLPTGEPVEALLRTALRQLASAR